MRPTRHHTASHAKNPTVTVGVLIIKMVRANYGTSQEPAEKREDKKMRVGFIGLGKMGSAMARNLIKAGHELVLYNRTRRRAEELQPLGARVAETPAEAAHGVEALITMLADDPAVEDAMLGPGQALQSLPAGAVHIGMSTISVALSRRLTAARDSRYSRELSMARPHRRAICEARSRSFASKLARPGAAQWVPTGPNLPCPGGVRLVLALRGQPRRRGPRKDPLGGVCGVRVLDRGAGGSGMGGCPPGDRCRRARGQQHRQRGDHDRSGGLELHGCTL